MRNVNHPDFDPDDISRIISEAESGYVPPGDGGPEPWVPGRDKPFSGDLSVIFEEIEVMGKLYYGELVVDIITGFDYDHGMLWEDTKFIGINDLKRTSEQDLGELVHIDSRSPRNKLIINAIADDVMEADFFRDAVEEYLSNLGPDY